MIIKRNHVLFRATQRNSQVVLNLFIKEHPFIAERLIEHLTEIAGPSRVQILEHDPILVENAAQNDLAICDLEVLKLVNFIVARLTLHFHKSILCFEQN